MNQHEPTCLKQAFCHATALATVAAQQDRCPFIQLLQGLLDKRQRDVDRAGQCAALVFVRVANVHQLGAFLDHYAGIRAGNCWLVHDVSSRHKPGLIVFLPIVMLALVNAATHQAGINKAATGNSEYDQ